MPQFSGIGFLKNFVNLSSILHSPIHLTPQHLFLLYPHLFFILSSKLTSSANHFLLSLFHSHLDGQFSGSIWLSSVLFISQSFSLYHSQPSHSIALRPNIVIQCLGISLLQISFVWLVFCRHFKSPHSFRCYHLISLHCVYIHLCYHLIFMWGNRNRKLTVLQMIGKKTHINWRLFYGRWMRHILISNFRFLAHAVAFPASYLWNLVT